MQPLAAGPAYTAYLNRLKSSHDFSVEVDVLDLDENLMGSATFLDGQVNFKTDGLTRREATLTLSDPGGALDFTDSSAYSGTSIWVNRLVRIRHIINVPGYGDITAIVFIGPPTGMSRSGAEVQAVCADKGALAIRGAKPLTLNKGANAVKAIRQIMADCTGEFRFRLPPNSRKLSKAYAVGLTDDASPLQIATNIATHELGQQIIYSCDGYLTLRDRPSQAVADMGYVTDQASTSVDFTTIVNYVKVTGHVKSQTHGSVTTTTTPTTIQSLKNSSNVSPHAIQRQGVDRWLPLEISEPAYTTVKQTAHRAAAELDKAGGVAEEISASVIPMFHLDFDDLVTVHTTANGTRTMRLQEASIPLGVGGDMTVGFRRQVSSVALAKAKSRKVRTRKVHRRHR